MRVVGLAFPVGLESHAHPWAEGQWPRGAGWRNFKLNVAMGFACFSHGKLLRDLGEDGLCLPDKHLGGKYGAMRPGTGGGSGWGLQTPGKGCWPSGGHREPGLQAQVKEGPSTTGDGAGLQWQVK